MRDLRRLGTVRRWLLASCGVLVLAVVPLSAVARDPSGRPAPAAGLASASHPTYTLPNSRAKCKAHYKKESYKVHKVVHHKKVAVTKWRCVWAGSGSSGGGGSSGSSGSGGGSSGSGGGSSGSGGGSSSSSGSSPVAVGDSYSTSASVPLTVAAPGVLGNDHGSGLSADLLTDPAHGTVTLSHAGGFTYTPSHGFSGVDSFTYKDTDASFNSSAAATVAITVDPTAVADGYTASSGSLLTVASPGVLANDLGVGLSAELVSSVSHGSLTFNSNGSFHYTSDNGFTGSDSFTYRAIDALSHSSSAVTVTLTVGAAMRRTS